MTRIQFGLTATALIGVLYAVAGVMSHAHNNAEVGLCVAVAALTAAVALRERRSP